MTGDAANITVVISKDGGTAASATNSISEVASMSGFYRVELTQAETNADTVAIKATSSTADVRCSSAVYQTIDSTAAVVDAVWDEALSGHTTAGTAGKALTDTETGAGSAVTLASANNTLLSNIDGAVGGTSIADLVDAVWDEALSGHTTAGTTGKKLSDTSQFDNSTDTVSVSIIGGEVVTGLDDLKADVSGLSTFDPSTQEVDVGKVNGVAVSGIEDFKADVSGLSTFDPTSDTVLVAASEWGDLLAYAVGSGNTAGSVGKALEDVIGNVADTKSTLDSLASLTTSVASDVATTKTSAATAALEATNAKDQATAAASDTSGFASNGIALTTTQTTSLVESIWSKAVGSQRADAALLSSRRGDFLQETSNIDIDGQTVEQALRIVLAALAGK